MLAEWWYSHPKRVGTLKITHHRSAGLDALRGVAILMVVIYHIGIVTLASQDLKSGAGKLIGSLWTGVDVFFVLSGYLITKELIAGDRGPTYYQSFYLKRVFRILPIYYLALAVSLLAAAFRGEAHFALTVTYIVFLQNLPIAMGHWMRGISHFWSLAVEEQYYLAWPLLCRRLNRRTLFCLSLSAFLGSFLLRVAVVYGTRTLPPFATYTFTLTHLDGIALGSMVAIGHASNLSDWIADHGWKILGATSAALMALLIALPVTLIDGRAALAFLPFVTSIWTASAVSLIAESPAIVILGDSCLKVLRDFGTYSYSIYVFHPFLLQFLTLKTAFLPSKAPMERWVVTIAAMLAGVLFFYGFGAVIHAFIESPIQRARNRELAKLNREPSRSMAGAPVMS
jgi:peptidoglycan/LPS O-acetylase OafA/YrhL